LSNSKRNIRVQNSEGGTWTTRKRALALVARGIARYVGEHLIEMIESDYRFMCGSREELQTPTLEVAPMPEPIFNETESLRTFCRYPEPGSFRPSRLELA
jgi:hypothetical protein